MPIIGTLATVIGLGLRGTGLGRGGGTEPSTIVMTGSGFGSAGEGYFRISAFNSRANVEEVCRRLKALVG